MAMKKMVFIIFLVASCSTGNVRQTESRPRYYENPDSNPVFLSGRLPGDSWKEHEPAKFGANQSFEAIRGWEKAILFVKFDKSSLTIDEYISFIEKSIDQKDPSAAVQSGELQTPEGNWKRKTITLTSGYYDFFVIRKREWTISVHFIVASADTYIFLRPDVENYIKNFWFLYDKSL